MISFGFWNVIILITVALFLKFNWRLDPEKFDIIPAQPELISF